jgi:hypothetical protein
MHAHSGGGSKWSPGGSLNQWSRIASFLLSSRIRICIEVKKSYTDLREKLDPDPYLCDLDRNPAISNINVIICVGILAQKMKKNRILELFL